MQEKSKRVYEYFSSVTPKDVEWLWYPYIPYGKITLLQGDPGEGKSTFILNIAASMTKGENMPDGSSFPKPQTVVYQCSEDDISDTIKPRLIAAGADCKRVAYIIDDTGELNLEDQRIEETIRETGARLLILDPIQSFLAQDGDMHNVSRIRSVLSKLSVTAAKHRCAVVLVGHMNKSVGGKNLYRSLGSIDIAAIARSVLMVARDDENSEIRYMFPVKSSLAPEGPPIGFTFDPVAGFQWIGTCKDAVRNGTPAPIADEDKGTRGTNILLDMLSLSDKPSVDVINALRKEGISKRTIYTLKKKIGIESYKSDGVWFWRLSPETKHDIQSEETEE